MKTNIIHVDQVSSTQDVAREMMPQPVGTVIVADIQKAGRGRRGNVWLSPRGGLYASIILWSDPLLSLRVGVAVACALQRLEMDVRLKWPNDVLVADKKIAGILIEATGETSVVGIGVNIDSSPLRDSTCVTYETERDVTRDALLDSILQEIEATRTKDVIEGYRTLCSTIGRAVQVDIAAGKKVTGIALGIDRDGHLLVSDGKSEYIVVGGGCQHLDRRV